MDDATTKGFWNRIIHELEHLNQTLNKLLKIAYGSGKHHHQLAGNTETSDDESRPAERHEPWRSVENSRYFSSGWFRQLFHRWKPRIETLAYLFAMAYAVITFFQWKDANRNFRIDERGWQRFQVIPTEVTPATGEVYAIDFTAGRPIQIPMTITNTGKTPVFDIKTDIYVEVVDRDKGPRLSGVGDPNGLLGMEATTGINFPAQVFQTLAIRPPLTTEEESADLKSKPQRKYVAMYGRIQYRDAFKTQHWTQFCWTNLATYQMGHQIDDCTAYNDVDKND
ncbi:hypothetical protein [Tunturiibacter lichenicola]|uniref:hypothetical protein n=1 Tax=Tunturiibacter lichenicola TaxID=2051959 RepID=UPI0021B21CD0|nr:hypothetical protein [Edaphobacter lichenicola]